MVLRMPKYGKINWATNKTLTNKGNGKNYLKSDFICAPEILFGTQTSNL